MAGEAAESHDGGQEAGSGGGALAGGAAGALAGGAVAGPPGAVVGGAVGAAGGAGAGDKTEENLEGEDTRIIRSPGRSEEPSALSRRNVRVSPPARPAL